MHGKFPSPTGVNHYELSEVSNTLERLFQEVFPSPTGVNHYELYTNIQCVEMLDNTKGFRPQQGLTIMNL